LHYKSVSFYKNGDRKKIRKFNEDKILEENKYEEGKYILFLKDKRKTLHQEIKNRKLKKEKEIYKQNLIKSNLKILNKKINNENNHNLDILF
jgi:hypothetical protein